MGSGELMEVPSSLIGFLLALEFSNWIHATSSFWLILDHPSLSSSPIPLYIIHKNFAFHQT